MKTIWILIWKDLRRDWKHPWTILLFSALPLLMTGLIAIIFGGHGGQSAAPTIHVAVVDNDRDFLTRALRSLSGQGDAARKLRLHFVGTRSEGLQMLESYKASALVIFPTNMTDALLDGKTNTIELYENPAEQILPKIVHQGVSMIAQGLSEVSQVFGDPLRNIRLMMESNSFPTQAAFLANADQTFLQMKDVKTYFFPPLIEFETIDASNYVNRVTTLSTPSHE